MWIADSTRVGLPTRSRASCSARAFITVPEHPHDVRGRTVHALAGSGGAPPDVAAADDDGYLDIELVAGGADLLGEPAHRRGVDGLVRQRARERLARELEHDAVPRRLGLVPPLRGQLAHSTRQASCSRADDGLSETKHLALPSCWAIVCCSSSLQRAGRAGPVLCTSPAGGPRRSCRSPPRACPRFWRWPRRSCGSPRPARRGRPRAAGTRDGRKRCGGRSRGRAPRRRP